LTIDRTGRELAENRRLAGGHLQGRDEQTLERSALDVGVQCLEVHRLFH
jgi:hypothetical protein